MMKNIYYFIANIFYRVNNGDNVIFEYFYNKAESIAEDEYNKIVTKFYEG